MIKIPIKFLKDEWEKKAHLELQKGNAIICKIDIQEQDRFTLISPLFDSTTKIYLRTCAREDKNKLFNQTIYPFYKEVNCATTPEVIAFNPDDFKYQQTSHKALLKFLSGRINFSHDFAKTYSLNIGECR